MSKYADLLGRKIKSSDVELKTVSVSGNTGSGASISTGLDSSKTKVIGVDCTYPCVPWIYNGKYYIAVQQYMHIGSNLYAFAGVVNTNVSATVYYVEVA